jgi:hypothetical protein
VVATVRITAVLLLKIAFVAAGVAAVFGVLSLSMALRSRDMRALATRRGFHYVGPASLRTRWVFLVPKITAPLHIPFSIGGWPITPIRQVWNVIEGEQDGVPVFIFDCLGGTFRYYRYRTFFACKTEQSPFENPARTEDIKQMHGWTVVYRGPVFLEGPLPWSIGIRRLEGYLDEMRVSSSVRA